MNINLGPRNLSVLCREGALYYCEVERVVLCFRVSFIGGFIIIKCPLPLLLFCCFFVKMVDQFCLSPLLVVCNGSNPQDTSSPYLSPSTSCFPRQTTTVLSISLKSSKCTDKTTKLYFISHHTFTPNNIKTQILRFQLIKKRLVCRASNFTQ